MTLRTPIRPATAPTTPRIPPLQNGDRLTRAEFERRFDVTPSLKKAELIEGVVYMPPAVSVYHSTPHFNIITLLGLFAAATPGVEGGDNGSLRLDLDNMPQPDAYLRIHESRGGQSRIDRDNYVEGAPELIVEVAATSASYDLHDKLSVYERHGVREYIVWRVLDEQIDLFVLRDGKFHRIAPDEAGVFRSMVFPGLWIPVRALLSGDLASAAATLQQGLATPEHAALVNRLGKPAS